jgi:hypothetical protein
VLAGVVLVDGALGAGELAGGFVLVIGGVVAGAGLVLRLPPQATKQRQQNKIKQVCFFILKFYLLKLYFIVSLA